MIAFKRLAGTEDDEPLGKFEDSVGAFKSQALNKVGKRWIPFGRAIAKGGSPSKENNISPSAQAPRALIYFYYGDREAGSHALE